MSHAILTKYKMRKTKIIATIGPKTDTEEMMEKLIKNGVDVFRFNMKHGTIEWHKERIQRARKIAKKLNQTIGIFIDLQGPEIRIETKDKENLCIRKGAEFLLSDKFYNNIPTVKVSDPIIFKSLEIGDQVLIDDGFQEFKVIDKNDKGLILRSRENYVIEHRKGLNLPGKRINLPSLIENDYEKLKMAKEVEVDFVALSFCRNKKDIDILKEEIKKLGLNLGIIAKIENKEALENIDEIIENVDSIMIARGDLGIENPIEEIAYIQKQIIEKCREKNVSVIVATQMLQSMVQNSRPTRAEPTDVANAIFNETDAIMLSGETATGEHPIRAVQTMNKIVVFNEDKKEKYFRNKISFDNHTELIVETAAHILNLDRNNKIDKTIVLTDSGYTARIISSHRLPNEIIAITKNELTRNMLKLSFGIVSYFINYENKKNKIRHLISELKKANIVKTGDCILLISGKKLDIKNVENSIKILNI